MAEVMIDFTVVTVPGVRAENILEGLPRVGGVGLRGARKEDLLFVVVVVVVVLGFLETREEEVKENVGAERLTAPSLWYHFPPSKPAGGVLATLIII